jgi:hypothetical protein
MRSGKNKGKYKFEEAKAAYENTQIVTRIEASKKSKATQKSESPPQDTDDDEITETDLEHLAVKAKNGTITQKENHLAFGTARTLEAIYKAFEQRLKTQEKSKELIDRRSGYEVSKTAGVMIRESFLNAIPVIAQQGIKIDTEHDMRQMLTEQFKKILKDVSLNISKIEERLD